MRIKVIYLIVLYVACLMIANVTAGRITQLGPFTLPSAIYIFALTFTLIDLINAAVGKKQAQQIVYASFGANILMALYFMLAARLPAPPWFGATAAYSTVLGQAPRVVAASLAAFLISGLLDVELFARMREKFADGWRVVLSNAASTLVDSVIFVVAAFAGQQGFPAEALLALILGQYVVKMAVTALSVPLIYLVKAGVTLEGASPAPTGTARD